MHAWDTYPPSSEHLGSLDWCIHESVAWAAAVANPPTSNRVIRFSGEVMDTSNAAVLPKNQLGSKCILAKDQVHYQGTVHIGSPLKYQGQATI
eukprot:Em0015g413a